MESENKFTQLFAHLGFILASVIKLSYCVL